MEKSTCCTVWLITAQSQEAFLLSPGLVSGADATLGFLAPPALCSPAAPCSLDSGTDPDACTCLSVLSRRRQSCVHSWAPAGHNVRIRVDEASGMAVTSDASWNTPPLPEENAISIVLCHAVNGSDCTGRWSDPFVVMQGDREENVTPNTVMEIESFHASKTPVIPLLMWY